MKFLKNPNIPNIRASGIIVDYRISKQSIKTLKQMGIEVFFSCKIHSLYDAVCAHPDMMIHHIGNNLFIVAPEAYNHFKRLLPQAKFIKGSQLLSGKYPDDVVYNTAAFGNFVICNTACTAIEILETYRKSKKKILNVNQGYAKCSVCIISENAIITADQGIYNKAVENKIDVLKISEGHIDLPGMSYGFIGGASGLIAKNMLAINGDLKTHPDCNIIHDFCKNHGVEIIPLKTGKIEDIGSILPVF